MRHIFDIPYYHDYISPSLVHSLLKEAKPITQIPDLVEVGKGGGLETKESLRFLVDVYEEVQLELARVLQKRQEDRKFIDERVKACSDFNTSLNRSISDSDYKTIIGLEDATGRIVLGNKTDDYCKSGGKPIAPIPEFLKGPHVTLFGPPDSAKMAINAMNSYHRKLKNEPVIVEELLKTQKSIPKWGADDEDSKTPLRQDLVDAAVDPAALVVLRVEVAANVLKGIARTELERLPVVLLCSPCSSLWLIQRLGTWLLVGLGSHLEFSPLADLKRTRKKSSKLLKT